MAQSYYKIAGTTNPTTDWRVSADLEMDDDGNVTRRISVTEAQKLNAEEVERLEASGLVLEQVSADEAKELAEASQSPVVGNVTGSPVFNPPSPEESGDEGKSK